jgi:hypothetical protein
LKKIKKLYARVLNKEQSHVEIVEIEASIEKIK